MKKIYLITIGVCIFIACIWLTVKKYYRPSQPTYSISRNIQYSFTIRNTTNSMVKEAEFWAYAPVKQTGTQCCGRLESSHPCRLITDDSGNQILHFTFDNIAPYTTRIISIKADLLVSVKPNPIPVRNPQSFLRTEKYIESDDPSLRNLALKLKARESLKTAEKVFHWVANNIRHAGYLKNDRGALYALKNKVGDCTEFMYLFAALCRANGIPARCIAGYICRESSPLKPTGYHNWAEFYEDGTWRIADPQNRVFMKDHSNYIAMKLLKGSPDNASLQFNRFRVKGRGLTAKMNMS